MIKNRIRTAALAGAVAVATGVSGLAVPAMAQENDDQNATTFAPSVSEGFNEEDGSAEANPAPENVTEEQLQARTNTTAEYLDQGIIGTIQGFVADAADGFDPSEEAARNLFEGARAEATAELAQAAQNVTDARASVEYALDRDREAAEAWEAFEGAIAAAAEELNPLINAVNVANTHSEFEQLTPLDPSNPVAAWNALLALQITVDGQYETAGEWNIDQDDERYVNTTHMEALEALKEALDGQVEDIAPIRDAALDAGREAQKSDVLARQLFLERATAQRDTLRVIEAIFSSAVRSLELYEADDNQNVEGQTLREHYMDLLAFDGDLFSALSANLNDLEQADEAVDGIIDGWGTDLENNNDGEAYPGEKLDFAFDVYGKIIANTGWQESLKYVTNLDDAVRDTINEREARQEAERAAAELREREIEAEEERNRLIREYLESLENSDDAPANEDDQNDDDNNGSSIEGSSNGNLGIFAVLAGVIGLIAAAFPFVSNFLNLNR